MRKVEIYTDGACSGNPGRGGWGAIICDEFTRKEISGGEDNTTNNRMEMLAAIRALQKINEEKICEDGEVLIFTDSQYLKKGITEWIKNWVKNGWKNRALLKAKKQLFIGRLKYSCKCYAAMYFTLNILIL